MANGLARPGGRSRPAPRHFSSLAGADAFAGALTRGSIKTFPATAETENTASYQGGAWLPFLDTYRTMCLAPQPDFRRVLEDVQAMQLAA
jgi:hypothetical protein